MKYSRGVVYKLKPAKKSENEFEMFAKKVLPW
jgi:hypothetical protein